MKEYEESHTLYNLFYKGKPIPTNLRGYRIPFYDRPPASDMWYGEGGALPVPDNPTFSDMRVFPARYATSFQFSGDVIDSINGNKIMIDKVSDLYMYHAEAAKKSIDFQIAGTKKGAIVYVKSAVTGANGTVTCAATVADGGTFGSFKVKDGARIHFVNGSSDVARGSPTTGVVKTCHYHS